MHSGLKEMESKAIQDYNENFLNLSPDPKQKLVEFKNRNY
jgi:hypothetical protein